jgi:CubicO group peptidase (beta-lactamase class C family)
VQPRRLWRGRRPINLLLFTSLFWLMVGAPRVQAVVPLTTDDDTGPGVPITAANVEAFFDALFAQQMADQHIVGATVSAVKDGELLFAKGYGYADREAQVAVAPEETLFYPGSTGKLLTWTALMQLVEQGKIDLHADVNQYLDFTIPPTFAEPITVEHLLTHTTGFEEQLAALLVADEGDVLPLGDFLRRNLPARVYPPGTTWAYSNYATGLAGYIIERVSGQPYAAYVTEHLLTPLAMTHSSVAQPLPAALMATYAKGYHYRNGEYASVDFEWVSNLPSGPLRTTATDMANFMLAHLNGGQLGAARILAEATSAAMQQRQFAHDPHVNGMGYGFMWSMQNGKEILWHTGGSAYFNTMMALIPEEEVGFFVSYNTPVGDLYQPLAGFVDHFYPAAAAESVEPPAETAQQIAALQGRYVSSRVAHQSSQKLVTWQAEALTVQPGPHQTLQVGTRIYRATAPGVFQQVDGPRTLTYRTDEQGEISQIFWMQFAYFKVPWYQTALSQLLFAGGALLIMLSGVVAWPVAWLVRRRRGQTAVAWSSWARWTAAGTALFNLLLLGWFLGTLLGFAESFVYPTATVDRLTWLWWLNIPVLLLLFVFTGLAWRRRVWPVGWRVHYTLVTAAALLFVLFLANWHLLSGL